MSCIEFNSPDRPQVRVGGAERDWARFLCAQIAHGVLDIAGSPSLDRDPHHRLLRMVPEGHYLRDLRRHGKDDLAATALRSLIDGDAADALTWNGHRVDGESLVLNTALAVGGDALRLSARVIGTCEIHGWIDGPNRAWIADMIEEGLASGVLRRARQTQYENWPGLVTLLRSTSRSPVVMSSSFAEPFPGFHLVSPRSKRWDEMTEAEEATRLAEEEAWDQLDPDVRWEQALAALRDPDDGLEIRPESWSSFRFSHGLSALDLMSEDWEARLDRAFPRP